MAEDKILNTSKYKKAKEFYGNYKLDENDEISKDNAPVKITPIDKAKKINLEEELKKSTNQNRNTINTDNKTVISTGTDKNGRKIIKYSDGSAEYAN